MAADQLGITTVPGQQLQYLGTTVSGQYLHVQPQMQTTLPVQPPIYTTPHAQPPMQPSPHAQPQMQPTPHAQPPMQPRTDMQPQTQPTSPQQLLLSALDLIRHAMAMIEYATKKLN